MSTNGSGRAGTIAAAAATLTAIVAVVIALWDNVQTRRHNRLSVEDAGTRIQALFDGLRLRLRYASVYGDAATESFGEWPAGQ